MSRLMMGLLIALAMMLPTALLALDFGSDGSDGAFNPTGSSYVVNLALAADGAWNTPSPVAGRGVYDAEKWAVVFKYTSVNIPPSTTVTFTNHPKGAPVIWLVQGDVTINGAINLNGVPSTTSLSTPIGGPGGFRAGKASGGASSPRGAGFGPGGGAYSALGGGSYGSLGTNGTRTYGNTQIVPLIGGSGGAGNQKSGGSGGGAILIAANGTISLGGSITSNGGVYDGFAGGGSGGAIRLLAESVGGSGALRAVTGGGGTGQAGGAGRIRVEASSITLTDAGNPLFTPGLPGSVFPDPLTAPVLRILDIASRAVPLDPTASLDFPGQDVEFSSASPISVRLEARNVPTGWSVLVRAIPRAGTDIEATATLESGDTSLSYWTATLTLPDGASVLQAFAKVP